MGEYIEPGSEQKYVEKWLKSHEDFATSFVESWLESHPTKAKRYCNTKSHGSTQNFLPNTGITVPEGGQLLKQYISTPNLPAEATKRRTATELRKLDRQELFVELLKDVVSPDFDVNSLSHKILVNVLVLTNADRSSLFLAEGSGDNQVLVSRLFDVMDNTTVEDAVHDDSDAIKLPFGVGIIGAAAKSGKHINLQNAYDDPRFNRKVDQATGYRTKSILCMPIKSQDGEVIGVAQVINKNGGQGVFTKQDEEDFSMYLNFCAIGLLNSHLLDQSLALSRRLQVLLQLTWKLFQDTTSLDAMMKKIMLESIELIPCERYSVLLIDQEKTEKVEFSRAFQVEHPSTLGQSQASIKSQATGKVTDLAIAERVAVTAKPVNTSSGKALGVTELADDVSDDLPLDADTKSILCVPIKDKANKVIGVAMLTNKLNNVPFNQTDQESFEIFSTFCGLGLHNVMIFEKIAIANARQKVAFEVLAYHASAPVEEAERLVSLPLPEASAYALRSFRFDDHTLSEDHTVLASVRMFVDGGFQEKFKIPSQVLYRWVLTVKKNYRQVTYHNWRHAFNVAQTMFAAFTDGRLDSLMSDNEKMALLIGCFCHDLDHRGTNNDFQSKSESPLAQLYSTSTMEHHHFDHCVMILNSEGNQILDGIPDSEYNNIIGMLESAILSTDLALYFKKKGQFKDLVLDHQFVWKDDTHRDLLRGMLMTACDVAAITKPWEVQKRVATLVASEFFEQGDAERSKLKIEPIAMMDRKKKDELPKMQVGFINFICLPLYEVLAELLSGLNPLLEGVKRNQCNWQALVDNPNGTIPYGDDRPDTVATLPPTEPICQTSPNHNLLHVREPIQAWSSDTSSIQETPTVSSRPSTVTSTRVQVLPKRKVKCVIS